MTAFGNMLLFSLFFAAACASATQAAVARDLPDGLSIPNDITLWGNFEYAGCWTDKAAARSLTALSYAWPSMTIETCLQFCNEREGYYNLAYVGLEYAQECYCDWVLQDTAVQVDDSECNMPCAGNASQPCGSSNRMTLLSLRQGSPTTAPETLLLSSNWTYQGCYQDSISNRILPYRYAVYDPQYITLEQCAFSCGQDGYTYAGIEYRNECYCGTSLPTDAVLESDNECGMACIYDYFERCGGPDRISVYKSS